MRRFTVALPDGLYQRAKAADLNMSSLLAERVQAEVANVEACPHTRLRCQQCGAALEVDPAELGVADEADAETKPQASGGDAG